MGQAYDCVIATRNRVNALRMSIPLILRQDLPPERLVVVDASDDHESVKTEVENISHQLGFGGAVIVKADRPNLARQRNVGLQLVQSPIVMFPDDDSMWYQGFAGNVMKVYEADRRKQVGGVGGVGVIAPPPELERPSYKMSKFKTIKHAIQPYRNYIEYNLVPKPFDTIASSSLKDKIDVVDLVNSRRMTYITGFRMSFRTDVVKSIGFDETLGYGAGYSYHEDIDISLQVQGAGYAVVSAEAAKVCHLSFPGKRADDYAYGFFAIANCVYVCKKAMNGDRKNLSVLERYLKYKLSLYASRFLNEDGRLAFYGAFDAWRNRDKLLNADRENLSDAYKDLCDQRFGARRALTMPVAAELMDLSPSSASPESSTH